MIALSRKKSMQYVLLEAQEAAEQCVIIVLDELNCWPVSRYRPARTPRRTTASTRCQLSAVVKPHQALDA